MNEDILKHDNTLLINEIHEYIKSFDKSPEDSFDMITILIGVLLDNFNDNTECNIQVKLAYSSVMELIEKENCNKDYFYNDNYTAMQDCFDSINYYISEYLAASSLFREERIRFYLNLFFKYCLAYIYFDKQEKLNKLLGAWFTL